MSTRERIVEAAARLFHEQGYQGTGISTILREAGANPGSLYHFFRTKDDLLRAVLEHYEHLLQPVVLGPVESAESDPIERIFKLLEWYRAGMVETGCRLGCPLGNLALEVSDTHPEVRPGIEVNMVNWRAGIRRWLDAAGDRLPADCDRDALAFFVLTVMEGGLLQARAASDLAGFDASVRVLRDHFNRLLEDARIEP
ncbi:MAG: TetR/AcrR family transcriptional regulator [Acidobacteriota bacterium]